MRPCTLEKTCLSTSLLPFQTGTIPALRAETWGFVIPGTGHHSWYGDVIVLQDENVILK